MQTIESSIVIPVYNNWILTRSCMQSLAATIDPVKTEVVLVDNSSKDETASSCQMLGRQLFGSSFQYIRNEINRNFAGASNQEQNRQEALS